MARMVNTVTMASGSSFVLTAEVGDQSAADLVAFVIETYPQQNDENGTPVTRDAQWAVKVWWDGCIIDTLNNVHNWKKDKASRQAAESVQPINVTLT